MQSVSSRIWTRVVVSISYDDTDYTTGTSIKNKKSDGEVPVILEPWGIRSTPSLPLLQDPHSPGVVVPDRALSMG